MWAGKHGKRKSHYPRPAEILTGTDTQEKIQERLIRAKVECQTANSYDYFVINDTVEKAVAELNAIMCAEHCRPAERMNQILGKE